MCVDKTKKEVEELIAEVDSKLYLAMDRVDCLKIIRDYVSAFRGILKNDLCGFLEFPDAYRLSSPPLKMFSKRLVASATNHILIARANILSEFLQAKEILFTALDGTDEALLNKVCVACWEAFYALSFYLSELEGVDVVEELAGYSLVEKKSNV